ncbi:hypothetical protein MY1884_004456 [Beauveria asiatica]
MPMQFDQLAIEWCLDHPEAETGNTGSRHLHAYNEWKYQDCRCAPGNFYNHRLHHDSHGDINLDNDCHKGYDGYNDVCGDPFIQDHSLNYYSLCYKDHHSHSDVNVDNDCHSNKQKYDWEYIPNTDSSSNVPVVLRLRAEIRRS